MAEYQAVPKKAIEKLEESRNCDICRDVCKDPKQLQCQHAYCKECLQRQALQDRQQGRDVVTCPTCRKTTPLPPPSTVADLPAAFHVNQLADIVDAMNKKPEIVKGLLQSLYEDLHSLAPSWFKFGVCLGIDDKILKGLQGEDSMVERCFIEVLSAWLKGGDASADNLIAALRSRGMAKRELASKIENDKKNGLVKLALPYLMGKLSSCKPEWFALGSALGIPDEELRKFESEKKSPGVDRCLHGTLRIWLESEVSDSEEPEILDANQKESLLNAVQVCGEEELSRILELKY